MLINKNKDVDTAKEFLLHQENLTKTERDIINRFDRYGLELVCIKVLSLLYNDVEESSLTRMSRFIQQLANYVRF